MSKRSRASISYVINPETGRPIIKGGDTYSEERGRGVRSFKSWRKPAWQHARYYQVPRVASKSFSRQGMWAPVRPLSEEIAGARARSKPYPRRRYLERSLRSIESHGSFEGRGSGTRGWSAIKPITVGERRKVFRKCGSKCFLAKPIKTRTGKVQLKFPVCGVNSCTRDPRGVLAAEQRAKNQATQMRERGDPHAAKYYDQIAQRAVGLRGGTRKRNPSLSQSRSRSPTVIRQAPSGSRRSYSRGSTRK